MSSSVIDTIGKLLAHAEGTSNQAEADAYVAKAQQLGSRHAVDLALAAQRHQQAQRAETLTTRRVTVVPEGLSPFYRKAYVELFSVIGFANDLLIDVAKDSSFVIPFGYPSDIEVTERLYASLLIQMVAEADRQIRVGVHTRVPRYPDEPVHEVFNPTLRVDARVWRNSFYDGYAAAIQHTLTAAKQAAAADAAADLDLAGEAGGDEVSLVLAAKAEKVTAFHKQASAARGRHQGTRSRKVSQARRAGAAAGRRAQLGSRQALDGARGELAS